jgi:hypothetical protein
MKTKRNLSGIYFRFRNPETEKWENRTFEDLPESDQNKYMAGRDMIWIKSLAKQLAGTLNEIGEQFDIAEE